jgi:large subunit ribosomal protein L4
MVGLLSALGLSDVLIVTDERNRSLELASRNLPRVEVQEFTALNPLSLLSYDNIVMTMASAKRIEERLA